MIGSLGNAGVMALLSMLVPVAGMLVGIMYAIWPGEARLALMRPLSLAGIFAALAGSFGGVVNALVSIGNGANGWADHRLFSALAESIVPLFTGFGCLTVAWLCVALGMRRQSS